MIKYNRKTNLVSYAERELYLAQDLLTDQEKEYILKEVHNFCTEGHSGGSAPYRISNIKNSKLDVPDYVKDVLVRVLSYKPLTPLTGQEDEWNEDNQNIRCYSVFKQIDGTITDHSASIKSDDKGVTWWTGPSKIVTFPYIPNLYPKKLYVKDIYENPLQIIKEEEVK